MTAIAGYIDKKNKKTYIASDSMGSNRFTGQGFGTKIFRNKNITFAVCGSYRIMKLLEYSYSPRGFEVDESVDDYVYKYLNKNMLEFFKDNWISPKKDDVYEIKGAIIFAIKDKLYIYQGDHAILEPEKHYAAEGSGAYHTESAIQILDQNTDLNPKKILTKAIAVTSDYVMSVGGKVHIIEHKHDDTRIQVKNKRKPGKAIHKSA